jgi:hypothetical protein
MNSLSYQEVLLFMLLAVVILLALSLRRSEEDSAPYQAQPALFTPGEQFFLGILLQAVDPAVVLVFGKVRLADVIMPKPELDAAEKRRAFNKISAKHVDFVLCKRSDLSVLGIIELDDLSHQRADRQARDEFVDNALAAAGIPILHIKMRKRYSVSALKIQLNTFFKLEQ